MRTLHRFIDGSSMALIRTLLGILIIQIANIRCGCENETSRCIWFETSPKLRLMNVSLLFDHFDGREYIISTMYDILQNQGCFRSESHAHSVTVCCCVYASGACAHYFGKFDVRHLTAFEDPGISGLHWKAVPDTRPPKWTIFLLVGLAVICITLIVMILLLLTYMCGCPCYHSTDAANNQAVIPLVTHNPMVTGSDNATPQPVTPMQGDSNRPYPVGMCPIPQGIPPNNTVQGIPANSASPGAPIPPNNASAMTVRTTTSSGVNPVSIDPNGQTNVGKPIQKVGPETSALGAHTDTTSETTDWKMRQDIIQKDKQ